MSKRRRTFDVSLTERNEARAAAAVTTTRKRWLVSDYNTTTSPLLLDGWQSNLGFYTIQWLNRKQETILRLKGHQLFRD